MGSCPVFPANNVWNTRIDSLPVDALSNTYVGTIGLSNKLHPDYGLKSGTPYTLVPGSQPKVNVTFNYASESDPGPYPIPANVGIEAGGDHHALIVDTTNCVLYELFGLVLQSDGWHAGSGAIFPLTSNALRPAGWTSADAAGLPMLPGLVRYDEVLAGHIDHAIRFTAPQTRNTYIWPARHAASTLTGTPYPQLGQRFRLKAGVDISPFAPNVQVILTALKQYGMILADNGSSWFISGVQDSRINDDEMHQLTQLVGADFEAVNEASLVVNVDSAQATAKPATGTGNPGGNMPTGWVNIVSKHGAKCLTVFSSSVSSPILQGTCLGGTNQQFQFTAVAGGYKITARSSGLQVELQGGPAIVADGAIFDQSPYTSVPSKIFTVRSTSDGYREITVVSSGKAITVRGASLADRAFINQWTWRNSDHQKWSFVPAS